MRTVRSNFHCNDGPRTVRRVIAGFCFVDVVNPGFPVVTTVAVLYIVDDSAGMCSEKDQGF